MTEPFYLTGIQYDAMHGKLVQDIEFYKNILMQSGGPVLELACGTGRLSIPLTDAGYQVTGIDNSKSMLEHARKKAPSSLKFLSADMRDFQLNRNFKTILLAFNSLCHLHELSDIENCFRCVRKHLDQDGLFVLHVFNPDLKLLNRAPNERREASRYRDPVSENEVIVTERSEYDRAKQLNNIYWHFQIGNREFDTLLRMRIFFPKELEALLSFCGFAVQEKFGDFDQSPMTSDSPQQILFSTKVRD